MTMSNIHCKTGLGFYFACGQSQPIAQPIAHALIHNFRPMMKLETMAPLLCADCVEVIEASERQG